MAPTSSPDRPDAVITRHSLDREGLSTRYPPRVSRTGERTVGWARRTDDPKRIANNTPRHDDEGYFAPGQPESSSAPRPPGVSDVPRCWRALFSQRRAVGPSSHVRDAERTTASLGMMIASQPKRPTQVARTIACRYFPDSASMKLTVSHPILGNVCLALTSVSAPGQQEQEVSCHVNTQTNTSWKGRSTLSPDAVPYTSFENSASSAMGVPFGGQKASLPHAANAVVAEIVALAFVGGGDSRIPASG